MAKAMITIDGLSNSQVDEICRRIEKKFVEEIPRIDIELDDLEYDPEDEDDED